MISLFEEFHADQSGATMVEYGLIVALIAMVCIAAVVLLGQSLSSQFNNVANQV